MAKVLVPSYGQGKELCDLLREALSIPRTCNSFTVRFVTGKPVSVNCDYLPLEVEVDDAEEDSAETQSLDSHRGLNG